MGSSKEEKFPMKDVLEGRTERGVEVAAIAELGGGNLKRDWRQEVHDRPELAPSNAVMLSEEEVTIGTTRYQTSVYEFTSTTPAPEGAVWSFKYWLAGGVPDGIVKVHIVVSEYDHTKRYEVDAHLAEVLSVCHSATRAQALQI
jgi:hypothetical protein